jgi:hypothetical protein
MIFTRTFHTNSMAKGETHCSWKHGNEKVAGLFNQVNEIFWTHTRLSCMWKDGRSSLAKQHTFVWVSTWSQGNVYYMHLTWYAEMPSRKMHSRVFDSASFWLSVTKIFFRLFKSSWARLVNLYAWSLLVLAANPHLGRATLVTLMWSAYCVIKCFRWKNSYYLRFICPSL